jgi:hypothetical protein
MERELPPLQGATTTPPASPNKRKAELLDLQDTPQVLRNHSQAKYNHGNIEQRRDAIMDSMPGTVPELPIQQFIDHLLPNLHFKAEELEQIYEIISQEEIYTKDKWKLLGESSRQTEVNEFRGFHQIQNAITEIGAKILGRESIVSFTSDGNKIPRNDWAELERARPDGGAALNNDWHLDSIFRVDEYKQHGQAQDVYDVSRHYHYQSLRSDTIFQNTRKCLMGLNFIFAHDFSRRFAFCLTIENRNARLYFSCRSFIAVSELFNINEVCYFSFVRIQ